MKKDLIIKICGYLLNLFLFVSSMVIFFRILFAPEGDIRYLRQFTHLSNIYMGLVSLFVLIFSLINLKKEYQIPKWLRIVELSGVTSVMLTFLTVILFLIPTQMKTSTDFINMYKNDLFFFHFLNPLLALFSFLFFVKGEKLSWKEAFFGVIPMMIYSIIYSILVINLTWNDFYGFTFGRQYWLLPFVLLIMYIVTYLISFLSSFIYNKIKGKKES